MTQNPYRLSLTEAADHLGVHADTLRRWTEDGKVACWTTPSGHRRYARSDLDALVNPEPTGQAS